MYIYGGKQTADTTAVSEIRLFRFLEYGAMTLSATKNLHHNFI